MKPLVSAYSGGAPGGVEQTAVDGGAPRTALSYDRGVQPFNVSMLMTPLKLSVWTTFFYHSIKKGAYSFTMPLDSGFGMADHLVTMIAGSHSTTRTGGIHTVVSFQVLAVSQAYEMSAADADALLALYDEYGEGTEALLRRLAQFALVDTLVLDF